MKRCVFLFGLITFIHTSPVNSQVVVDSSHINSPGAMLNRYSDTAATINPGSPGSGQVWNFTLNKHESDKLEFLSPSGLPLVGDFPGTNLAITFEEDNDSSWSFLEVSDTALWLLGISTVYEVDNIIDTISEPYRLKVISFPSSVGTTFVTSYTQEYAEDFGFDPDGPGSHPFVDSIKVSFTIRTESEIDADGTLNIESCTFDAIRQYARVITTDSASMYVNGNWAPLSTTMQNFLGQSGASRDTSHQLRWWVNRKSVGFPIVEAEVDENKAITGWVDWIADPCLGIEAMTQSMYNVYPNPASSQLTLSFEPASFNTLTFNLFDVSGRIIFSSIVSGKTIALPELNEGTYIYSITDGSDRILSTQKLLIKH